MSFIMSEVCVSLLLLNTVDQHSHVSSQSCYKSSKLYSIFTNWRTIVVGSSFDGVCCSACARQLGDGCGTDHLEITRLQSICTSSVGANADSIENTNPRVSRFIAISIARQHITGCKWTCVRVDGHTSRGSRTT